ncbi:MAG: GNAT family N-acetyltransferase [Ilumatobacteraceae bacterium]
MSAIGAELHIEPVGPDNARHLDTLFASGDPRTCQCAFLRLTSAEWSASTREDNRRLHRAAIKAAAGDGRAAGLIALRGEVPVGWVSFDERDAYRRLDATPLLRRIDDRPLWSVVCFVVAASARRTGIAAHLLDATLAYARAHGVRLLEAYPVDTTAPGRTKRSSSDLWRSTVPMFERAGFTVVEVRRLTGGTLMADELLAEQESRMTRCRSSSTIG